MLFHCTNTVITAIINNNNGEKYKLGFQLCNIFILEGIKPNYTSMDVNLFLFWGINTSSLQTYYVLEQSLPRLRRVQPMKIRGLKGKKKQFYDDVSGKRKSVTTFIDGR